MKECTSYFSLCCDKILDKKQFKRGRVGFGLQLGHAVLRGREGGRVGHFVSPVRKHGVMNDNTQVPFPTSPTFSLSFSTC